MARRAHTALLISMILVASLVLPVAARAVGTPPPVVQSWSNAVAISDGAAKSYFPQIAVSADGTRATAVWYRNVGAQRVIESASAIIDGNQATWGPTSTISAQGLPLSPQVALSSDGTSATAVWHFKAKIATGIMWTVQAASAIITGNDADWSPAQDISAPGGDATFAQVALSSNGARAIAMWNRKAPGEVSYAQSATATVLGKDAAWNAPVNASAPGADANYPQVAMSGDGTRATAVWTRKSAPDYLVQAACATIDPAGVTAWGPIAAVSATGIDQASPQVALSSDGVRAHAVWSLADGSGNFTAQSAAADIIGNTGNWGTPVDLSPAATSAQYPQVGCAEDCGRAWAVWDQGDGPGHTVQASNATLVGNEPDWAPPTALSGVGADPTTPQIVVSRDGLRATAVWSLNVAPDTTIQAASALLGETAQWSAVANLSGAGTTQTPQVGAATDGSAATAIWQGWSGVTRVITSASATVAIPPSAPSSLAVVPGDGQLTVSIAAPRSDGGSPIVGYQYSLDGSGTWLAAAADSTVITGLVNGTEYRVLVRAVNGVGPGAAASTSGTPMGPALVPVFDQPVASTRGFTVNMTNYQPSWTVTPSITSGTATVTAGTPVGSILPLTIQGMAHSAAATVMIATTRVGYHPGSAGIIGTSSPDPLGPNQALADLVAGQSGAVIAAVGGAPVAASVQRNDLEGLVTLSGPGWQLVIQAIDGAGSPIPLESGTLVLVPGSYLLVSAQGYAPGTPLQVWLFSQPIELGVATIDPTGSLAAVRIAVPNPAAGWHELQLNGYDSSGAVKSVSLSVRVQPQATARLSATNNRSRLKLTVKPPCRSGYRLRLQKLQVIVSGGSDEPITATRWVTLAGRHRTSGTKSNVWRGNLPRGTYRAVVFGACGRAGMTTGSVTLQK